MNGCLTGLVAITAGCATVDTWAAIVIGVCAGWFYLAGSALLVKLRIDDAVDAIPVHMVGGCWGVLATGLFTKPRLREMAFGVGDGSEQAVGWFYEFDRGSGDFSLLGCQIVGVLFIFGWTSVVMGSFFYLLNRAGMFRLDPLEEQVGMDISRHKGSAYEYEDASSAHKESVNTLTQLRADLDSSRSRRAATAEEEAGKGGADEPGA
jgi:ammonium transporter, Amt family